MTRHDMITHGYLIGAAGGKAHEENLGAAMAEAARREGHMGCSWPSDARAVAAKSGAKVRERMKKVLRLSREGYSVREIAGMIGERPDTVENDRYRLRTQGHDIPQAKPSRPIKIDRDTLRALHKLGLNDAEIAERMNAKTNSVSRARRTLGLKANGVLP